MDANYEVMATDDQSRQKKDQRQRLADYARWLSSTGRTWYAPDLDAYRDHLARERDLKPLSAKAYVGAVRSRYRELSKDPHTVQLLQALAPDRESRDAFTERALEAIQTAASFDAGRVEAQRDVQKHVRLDDGQIMRLLVPPLDKKPVTKQLLRDTTAIGLMLCAGINETELAALQVEDVYEDEYRELRVHVPQVPGGVERDVPVYDLRLFTYDWLRGYVKQLKRLTNASEGALFRGFYRGGMRSTGQPVTPRAIQKMMKTYSVGRDEDDSQTVTALQLHRTLAQKLFLSGIDVEAIQAHFGHKLITTTYEYIGPPLRDGSTSIDDRLPTADLERRLEWWREMPSGE